MTCDLDKRLHAYREDLADETLKGKVKAAKFKRGELKSILSPVADVKSVPDERAGIDTQLLFGDVVRVFDRADGWAWVQSLRDNYVGYLDETALSEQNALPTHRLCVPRSFSYREPDMKTPVQSAFSIGSLFTVVGQSETRGTRYVKTDNDHFLTADHLQLTGHTTHDYVSVAEKMLHTPYLWGGVTAFGIDCSGLVQLSMLMAGVKVQRDSDMQEKTIGKALGFTAMDGGLQRGDLVFWKGHVGIMRSPSELIHANGHTMTVAIEPLEDAIERIGYLYGFPRTLRRPFA